MTLIACDADTHITSVTDPEGMVTSYYYSGIRLHKVIDPQNHRTVFGYTNGLLTSITNPRSLQTTITYDESKRVTAFSDPLFTENYTYNDPYTEVSDTYGHHFVYYIDDYGCCFQIIDTLGYSTYFIWDKKRNITSTTNAKNQVTNFTLR